MSITANSTFTVQNGTLYTASDSVSVLGSSSSMASLTHPQLGLYTYQHPPEEVEGFDVGGPIIKPLWVHSVTVGGGVDALFDGSIRDVVVIERWMQGDVGCSTVQYRAMLAHFKTPPSSPTTQFVVWAPSYLTASTYNVIIEDLRVPAFDQRLLAKGYVPGPVELQMRLVSAV